MPNKVYCTNCPLIYSSDQGYFCALGYSYTYYFTGKSASDETGEHLHYADDCELDVVRFAGKEFRPTPRAVDKCPSCGGKGKIQSWYAGKVDCVACSGRGTRR